MSIKLVEKPDVNNTDWMLAPNNLAIPTISPSRWINDTVACPLAGLAWASRCSLLKECYDENQPTVSIKEGAEIAWCPLQLPTHRAARKSWQVSQKGSTWRLQGSVVL